MNNLVRRGRSAAKRVLYRLGVLERPPTKAERKKLSKRIGVMQASSVAPVAARSAAPASQVPVIAWLPTRSSIDAATVAAAGTELRAFRRLAKSYGQTLADTTALHDHHSLSPGRTDWASKWKDCKGKRILYFALSDYSGSFYKWAEGINRYTPHAVRLITFNRHRYGYPLDLFYMRGDMLLERFPEALNDILTLADEADVIHIKDQTGFMDGRNGLPSTFFTQFKKPVAYTLYGGTARKDERDATYQQHVKSYAAVVAMTPDLCFDWVKSIFVPHAVDEDAMAYSWSDGKLVMHTPSTPSRKGTDMFEEAASRISVQHGTRTEVITGTRHEYVMAHKPKATIFFDQAGKESEENGSKFIGWYGNSALEAAVFGVPTMAHLSQEAIERANRAGYDVEAESAILNTEASGDGLYQVMNEFFERSPQERETLAKATRAWIEKHHSYKSTAAKLSGIYESL